MTVGKEKVRSGEVGKSNIEIWDCGKDTQENNHYPILTLSPHFSLSRVS